MLCSTCGNDKSRVLKTYADNETGDIIRVRECAQCGHVWRTVESRMFPCTALADEEPRLSRAPGQSGST